MSNIVTDKLRELAAKIEAGETLDAADKIFAKNAFLQYADKLEKRSSGITKARAEKADPAAQPLRDYINQKRWEKEYKKLSGGLIQ